VATGLLPIVGAAIFDIPCPNDPRAAFVLGAGPQPLQPATLAGFTLATGMLATKLFHWE
jgi:hypothetical protein